VPYCEPEPRNATQTHFSSSLSKTLKFLQEQPLIMRSIFFLLHSEMSVLIVELCTYPLGGPGGASPGRKLPGGKLWDERIPWQLTDSVHTVVFPEFPLSLAPFTLQDFQRPLRIWQKRKAWYKLLCSSYQNVSINLTERGGTVRLLLRRSRSCDPRYPGLSFEILFLVVCVYFR
jgi:hypothetical protein